MSHVSKCTYCQFGTTDNTGSHCSVAKEREDPKTHPLLKRAIKSACKEADNRFQIRKAEGFI